MRCNANQARVCMLCARAFMRTIAGLAAAAVAGYRPFMTIVLCLLVGRCWLPNLLLFNNEIMEPRMRYPIA